MGCFPLIVLLLVGTAIGYLLAGSTGAVWGTAIGLLAGVLAAAVFAHWIRRGTRR